MGMFDFLLGKRSASTARPRNSKSGHSTQFGASQMTQGGPGSVHSVRKDLLRLAMRETLTRNGIPPGWVSADMLRTNSGKQEAGMHVRFQVKHWEPRLMLHGVALEQHFMHRLLMLDPQAHSWMAGFSWQFALEDTSVCPPLPHPGTWTAPQPSSDHTVPASISGPLTEPGGIIEGPSTLATRPMDDVRADLERLLAVRDQDLKRQAQGTDHFAPTRPAHL